MSTFTARLRISWANVVIAGGSRPVRYVLLCLSAFFIFDRRSIFRGVLKPFPGTGWVIGFSGIFTCVLVIVLCRPGLPRVTRAEERITRESGR